MRKNLNSIDNNNRWEVWELPEIYFDAIEKKYKLKEINQVFREAYSASEAAKGLIQDVKSGYEDLRGTFNVRQVEISSQFQVPEKLEELDNKINQIRVEMMQIEEDLETITEQTRPLGFWQKVKASIIDNIIGYILTLIIGIILAAFGLRFLF